MQLSVGRRTGNYFLPSNKLEETLIAKPPGKGSTETISYIPITLCTLTFLTINSCSSGRPAEQVPHAHFTYEKTEAPKDEVTCPMA